MRIAYVEDNMINLALVERITRMTSHSIVPYSEGEIALDSLTYERFDLILMDVELAGEVNGLEVVRQLRQRGIRTPIVAVTAYAMSSDRERCLEAGCTEYLPKPIPIPDLIALLERYTKLTEIAADTPKMSVPDITSIPLVPSASVSSPNPTIPMDGAAKP